MFFLGNHASVLTYLFVLLLDTLPLFFYMFFLGNHASVLTYLFVLLLDTLPLFFFEEIMHQCLLIYFLCSLYL